MTEEPTITIDGKVTALKDLDDVGRELVELLSEVQRELLSLRRRQLVLEASEKHLGLELKGNIEGA